MLKNIFIFVSWAVVQYLQKKSEDLVETSAQYCNKTTKTRKWCSDMCNFDENLGKFKF